MKKLGAAVLTALLCLFTACSAAGCGASKTTLYVLSYKPEYRAFFDYVAEIYLAENPDIKRIDYKAVDTNDYNTVFSSRIQSGYLDVFTSEVSYMMQGSNNYMKELTRSDYFDDIKPEYLRMGRFYDPAAGGEPKQLTQVLETVGCVVFYNKDIFDEYGLSEPRTWSEFVALCDFFKDTAAYPVSGKTRIEAPIVFGGKSEWPAMSILNAVVADTIERNQPDFFANIADFGTDPAIRFDNDNWKSVFSKIKKIAEYIPAVQYGLDYAYAPSYFSTGVPTSKKMYPMMIDGTWSYTQIDAEFTVGAFVLPAEENAFSDGKKNFATKPGMTLSVYRKSNKPDAAERYIELMFRPDVYAKFLELTKMPSVMKEVSQPDAFITGLFENDDFNKVEMYDSRMPRYMPLPSASELIALMKGNVSPSDVASNLQEQVELSKDDWIKYVGLSHGPQA